MLSCRDLANRVASDYIDKQLGVRERLAVWLHLKLCENCRRFIRRLKQVRALLALRPGARPPLGTPAADDVAGRHLAGRLLAEYRTQYPDR